MKTPDKFLKSVRCFRVRSARSTNLVKPRQIRIQLLRLDNQAVLGADLNQPKRTETLHKFTDAGPRGAHHRGQFFMSNAVFNAGPVGIVLTKFTGQVEERLAQPLFAVHRHKVGDDRLLFGDALRQVVDKTFQEFGLA